MSSGLTRRGFLGVAGGAVGLGALAVTLPGCSLVTQQQAGKQLQSRAKLPKPFRVPLPIPPVAKPTRRMPDSWYYDIPVREAEAEILPGLKTRIYGYDGIFPGPTIVSRRDRRTVVKHANELPVPIAVHLHGGHTPHDSDGYPTDLVLPKGGWSHETMPGAIAHGARTYVYPMRQRAMTLWYHDHRMDFTAPQMYRGLAGFHLVHDDEEDALPLPKGERDIPLMICDRSFDADGTFLYPSLDPKLVAPPGVKDAYMEGVLGDVVLVNGAPWPELEVTATKYRFRILNASNARRYQLVLDPQPSGGKAFVQVGSDGGLLAEPNPLDKIEIAQAERFDVVVDFSRFKVGSTVTLTNGFGDDTTKNVMRFRVARKAPDDSAVPKRLGDVEVLTKAQARVTRRFDFQQGSLRGHNAWLINGKPFDPNRIDASPALGQVERWRFTSDIQHPIHVHLDPFQILGGGGDYGKGWKDTVDMKSSETVDVLVRFTDYAGKYVFHCHNLEHEDMAMMANFRTHRA